MAKAFDVRANLLPASLLETLIGVVRLGPGVTTRRLAILLVCYLEEGLLNCVRN